MSSMWIRRSAGAFAVMVLGALVVGRRPEKVAPPPTPVAAVAPPPAVTVDPAASAAAPLQDTELGRLRVAVPAASPLAKAPTKEDWEAHGAPLPLPRASRCLAAVLGSWLRLECESRKGAGHSVAALSGSQTDVSVRAREHGITEVVFPLRRGDRRFFQLDEVKVSEDFRGYAGEGTETEVVPGVNVSVVWLEDEAAPRVVIADA